MFSLHDTEKGTLNAPFKPKKFMQLKGKIVQCRKNGRLFPHILRKIPSVRQDVKIAKIFTLKPWKTVFFNKKPEKKRFFLKNMI